MIDWLKGAIDAVWARNGLVGIVVLIVLAAALLWFFQIPVADLIGGWLANGG